MLKRSVDLLLAFILTIFLLIPMLLIGLAVRFTSPGPALYWSNRVGRGNHIFKMPKFRTMKTGTPVVATHLLTSANQHLTPIGAFLRKTSLDELPQLYSILKGDMSFVGPRPALYNQDDLIKRRTQEEVHYLRPGLTGWAQINGRDELSVEEKVVWDKEYAKRQSLAFDLRIMYLTFWFAVRCKSVRH